MEVAGIWYAQTTLLATAPLVKVKSHVQVQTQYGRALMKGLNASKCEQLWPLMLSVSWKDSKIKFYLWPLGIQTSLIYGTYVQITKTQRNKKNVRRKERSLHPQIIKKNFNRNCSLTWKVEEGKKHSLEENNKLTNHEARKNMVFGGGSGKPG